MRALLATLLLFSTLPSSSGPANARGRTPTKKVAAWEARYALSPRRHPKRLTRAQVRQVVHKARQRFGVKFRIDWQSKSSWIGHDAGKAITVSRQVAQAPGLSIDALSLLLAHEAAHARGIRSEPKADYWAARHGLRKLWGKRWLSPPNVERGLEAAYVLLRTKYRKPFDARPLERKTIDLHATGYPTLQSRWDLSVA
ncbi:MAG: hypothetical protein JRH20_06630, partial [Deltaproteobacteria bacterium]|nr:hypothetical protein [Deltaproteobacteria bacterium]